MEPFVVRSGFPQMANFTHRLFTALVFWLERGCCGQSESHTIRRTVLPYGSQLLIAQKTVPGCQCSKHPGPAY